MAKVFVSYSRDDQAAARSLASELDAQGNEVWLSGDALVAGKRWADQTSEAMRSANVVVLLIGSEPSDWVRNEWSQALGESWRKDSPVTVVPVVLGDAEPPAFLRDRQMIRVDDTPADWDRVARLLEKPAEVSFDWTTTNSARTELAERLTEIKRIASALPTEPDGIV